MRELSQNCLLQSYPTDLLGVTDLADIEIAGHDEALESWMAEGMEQITVRNTSSLLPHLPWLPLT
jgi:hypothetical protein